MKTAFIHDWLVSMRGGEKVLQELCVLFPDATVFTLFHVPGSVSPRIESMPIRVSPLNRLPGLSHYYRNLLPFMPWAVSTFDLRGYDLIISNSHAVAKGIRKPPGSFHICSCLTPMRFIWDMRSDYFHYGDRLGLRRSVLRVLLSSLRNWDRRAAASVDCFIANSHHVKQRIARVYGRTSDVIYSPVDTTFFTPDNSRGRTREPFFLIVSALVSYKRIDLAIDVFNRNGRPLLIVGQGPDLKLLKKRAKRNIEFKGFVSEEELRSLYRTCAAVILPGREDFGLVPLEAQACGRPAIAFASGGATETITDGSTGILFQRQEPSVLQEAIDRFMRWDYDPALLRANAERFSSSRFRQEIRSFISSRLAAHRARRRQSVPGEVFQDQHDHRSVRGITGFLKRTIDIMFSSLGLLLTGLPMLVLAWLIRRESPGPGFFSQIRLGLKGKRFAIYKLRTMFADAEDDSFPRWTVQNDPRCTRLGNVLRRWGLDELPQLWNVLKGDMSIVGPRPERPTFHAIFARHLAGYDSRLAVKGGITGLAQIRGWRGDTSIVERLNCDLEYLKHWSLWSDLLILLKTPVSLLNSTKEHAPGWGIEIPGAAPAVTPETEEVAVHSSALP